MKVQLVSFAMLAMVMCFAAAVQAQSPEDILPYKDISVIKAATDAEQAKSIEDRSKRGVIGAPLLTSPYNAAAPIVGSRIAASPFVNTYSAAAPFVNTYSAAAPFVNTYSAATPFVSAYPAAAPIVSAYSAAPIVSSYSAYPYAARTLASPYYFK